MINKQNFFFLALFTLFLVITQSEVFAKYASFIINEKTGRIYYQKNANTMNYPASLTKIMTLFIVFYALK